MNREDFQQLAEIRLREARTLLNARNFDGAYYLAGYAVECALKACIAKLTQQHDFPPERKFIEDCYSHEIDKLLRASGLTAQRDADATANPLFGKNWQLVKDRNEKARYLRWSNKAAKRLIKAIANKSNGVMQWIRIHW